jgi:DNA-binding XRE family transcriptional regulator
MLMAWHEAHHQGQIPPMVASMFTAAADALAAAVVELRTRAKLTQRQLAEAVGREQSYVGRIETGQRRVDLVEWVQICRACGAEPEVEIAGLVRRV